MNKRCPECGNEVPPTRRSIAVYCSDVCRERAHGKRLRKKHQEKILEERRTYRSVNATNFLIYRARHRAKRSGIPFNIEVEDIHVPDTCPVLGIPLIWNHGIGRKGFHPNSPSLDKIVPSEGYVKGNVRVISARANLLKNDATVEELEAVLADLKQIQESRR